MSQNRIITSEKLAELQKFIAMRHKFQKEEETFWKREIYELEKIRAAKNATMLSQNRKIKELISEIEQIQLQKKPFDENIEELERSLAKLDADFSVIQQLRYAEDKLNLCRKRLLKESHTTKQDTENLCFKEIQRLKRKIMTIQRRMFHRGMFMDWIKCEDSRSMDGNFGTDFCVEETPKAETPTNAKINHENSNAEKIQQTDSVVLNGGNIACSSNTIKINIEYTKIFKIPKITKKRSRKKRNDKNNVKRVKKSPPSVAISDHFYIL